jgi:hypothetical protein
LDWGLLFEWILATTLGWLLGWAILGEFGPGVAIGLAQWLVLRRELPNSVWWLVGTTVGWLAGSLLVGSGLLLAPGPGLFTSLLAGGIIGGLIGAIQWPILRQWVSLAALWIPASAAAWAIGFSGLFGSLLAGAIIGAVTGFLLEWLLRNQSFNIDKTEPPHRINSFKF